jgi:protein phosphatase
LRHRPLGRRVVAAIVTVAVVAAMVVAAFSAYRWTQTRYYLGESDGRVAIYQGIAQQVGPVRLSHAVVTSPVEVTSLPQVSRDRLAVTIAANSLADAQTKLDTFLRDAGPDSTLGLPPGSDPVEATPDPPGSPSALSPSPG